MRHILAFIAAVILLVFAGIIVWYNRTALTMSILVFAGTCITLAFLLAIPGDFRKALSTAAKYLPIARGSSNQP